MICKLDRAFLLLVSHATSQFKNVPRTYAVIRIKGDISRKRYDKPQTDGSSRHIRKGYVTVNIYYSDSSHGRSAFVSESCMLNS